MNEMKIVRTKREMANFMKTREASQLNSLKQGKSEEKSRSFQIAMKPHGCNQTGFMQSVQRRYRRSRFVMRQLASVGQLPGVLKK